MYFRGGGRSSWNNRGGQATTSSYFHGTSKPSITTTSSSSPTYGGSGAAQPAVSDPCVAMWVELEEVDLNAWRCLHTAGFKLGCILYVKDATENSTNQTSGGAEAAARSFIRRAIEAHNLPAPVMVAKKEEQAAPSSSAPAAEEAQPESSNIGSLFDFGFGGGETAPKRPAPATSAPKEEEEKPVELVEDPLRGVKVCSITEFFSSGAADGIDVVYISVPSIDPCGFVEDGAGSPLKPSTATATSPKKTGTIVDRRDAFIHECVEKGKHMLMDARVVATSLATTTKWTETVLGHTRLPKVLFQDSFCLGMWPTKKMELLRRAVFGHDPSKSKTSSPSSATGKYMPAGSRYGRTTFASGGSGSPTTTPQASLLGGLRHLRLYLCSGRMSGAAAPTPRPDVLDVLGYRAIFTILAIMNWEAPVGLWARALATEETSSGTSPAGRRLVVVSGSLFFTREVTVQGSPSSPTAAKKTPRAQTRTDVVEATFFLALREVEAQSLTITGTEGHLHITDPIFPTTAPSTEAEAAHAMLPQPTPAPQPVAVDPPADTVAPETKTPVREYRPTFIHHDIPVDAPPGGRRRITHEIPLFDADASAAELSFPDDRMWRSARDLLKASTTYGGYGGSSAYSPYGRGGGYGAYRYGGTSSSPARQRFSVADTTKQMDDLQHLWLVARVLESLRDSAQR